MNYLDARNLLESPKAIAHYYLLLVEPAHYMDSTTQTNFYISHKVGEIPTDPDFKIDSLAIGKQLIGLCGRLVDNKKQGHLRVKTYEI